MQHCPWGLLTSHGEPICEKWNIDKHWINTEYQYYFKQWQILRHVNGFFNRHLVTITRIDSQHTLYNQVLQRGKVAHTDLSLNLL